ncbi:oligosaccharide repeat unit polymerase [Psychrobacter sp. 1176_08]|uniref:O-antigen polymerase n=1 Tax=Psychrobacter sp. 1176_08 TaxID=2604452 RepID=UPI0040644664
MNEKSIMRSFYLSVLIFFLTINIILFNNAGYFTGLSFFNLFPSLLLLIIYLLSKIVNKKSIDWTAIDNIFIVLFYVFHFSYIYLYFLDMSEYDSEVFWDSRYIYQSIYFLTIAASSFLIGFNIIVKDISLISKDNNNFNYKSLYDVSKFFIIFAFLSFWLPIVSIISLAFSDYKSLISVGAISPIGKLYWIGQYVGVGALAIYYISRVKINKPLIGGISSYFAIAYILGYLVIGDRGGFIFYAVIPLIIYNIFYKKINLLKGVVIGVSVLSVSSILAVSRVNSIYNPIKAYEAYSKTASNNIIVSALEEFGKSFKTIPLIMSYIPEQYDYWYGKSYYESLLIIFPNLFGNRVSESISTWLTETAFGKDTYGRGGSILMESYGNFGLYGSVLFFIILGLISGKLYNKYKYSSNIYWMIAYIAFVASLCMWMRNSSAVVLRTVIWSLLMVWIAIHIAPYLPMKKAKI